MSFEAMFKGTSLTITSSGQQKSGARFSLCFLLPLM
jgi:hypothetical protein